MAAREQLNTIEMVWELMIGTTGHLCRTDFVPQKTMISPSFGRSCFEDATPESGELQRVFGKNDPGAGRQQADGYASSDDPPSWKEDL